MGQTVNNDVLIGMQLKARLNTLQVDPGTAEKTIAYLRFVVESSKSVVEFAQSFSNDDEVSLAFTASTLGLAAAGADLSNNKTYKIAAAGIQEIISDVTIIQIVNLASRADDPLSPAAYASALTAAMMQKGLTIAGIAADNQKAQCAIAITKLATDIAISGTTIETGVASWLGAMAAAQAALDGATAGAVCSAAFRN